MTLHQTEETIREIQFWYKQEIRKAAEQIGGFEKLSSSLGYDHLYLYKLIKRNSFSALRRIVKKIYEKK